MLELRQLLLLCGAILSSNLARDCYIRHINANLIWLQSNKVIFITFICKSRQRPKGMLIPFRENAKGEGGSLLSYGGNFFARCSLYKGNGEIPLKGGGRSMLYKLPQATSY